MNPKLSRQFTYERAKALAVILPVVAKEKGNINAIARALGVSQDSIRRWAKGEPRLRGAIVQARIRAMTAGQEDT